MLYVTTRSNSESFTSFRAISEIRAPDGGIFIPLKITPFNREELIALTKLSINQRLARILTRILGLPVSGVDLDLHIGRNPVRLVTMSHRFGVAETWHNPEGCFGGLVKDIGKVFGLETEVNTPCLQMSVRIAALFAVYGELLSRGILEEGMRFDISTVSGDFYGPMSGWYARELGLPIENIVCCCNENNGLWNLFYHGEFRTDQVCVNTGIPEADVTVPDGLECLVNACCGPQEAVRYLDAVRSGRLYCTDEYFDSLRSGFHVSVISEPGIMRTVPNLFSTSGTVLSSSGALAYAGLLDYRSRMGVGRFGLVLSDRSPENDCINLAKAFGVSVSDMREWLKKM